MNKTISLVVGTLLLVVLMSGIVLSVEEAVEKEQSVMIVGIIGDANQLVDTNGKIFDVADTQEGKEMLTHVGKKVQVKG